MTVSTLLFGYDDRFWIEQEISRKRKKGYVELASVQELSKEATGVHLNECVSLWVSWQLNGCTTKRV